MGVISRGIKDAFRNSIRTVSIVFILSLSVAMALVMFLALKTVQGKIASVKSSIGNYVSVSPAGIRGFEGGGELLTSAQVGTVSGLDHISKVVSTMSDRVTTDTDTNLQSAIEPGSFGSRQGSRQFGEPPSQSNSSTTQSRSFTMPIMINATSDMSTLSGLNVSSLTITSGEKFASDTTDNVALVGTTLATKNNLSIGSTFTAYGQEIKVVGIFDGGNTFANANLIMPLQTLQKLSGQVDQINSMIVTVDSIDNTSSAISSIQTALGDKADVTSSEDSSSSAIAPLENIKTVSLYSLIGSLFAGGIIIFMTMMMIVRERRREIGVLKAIGSSNIRIVCQYVTESMVLTLISGVIGTVLGVVFSQPIINALVKSSESTVSQPEPGRGMGAMMRIGQAVPGVQDALRDFTAVVDWHVILYGLGVALVIAIVGSAVPASLIAKVRPAEVMRAE